MLTFAHSQACISLIVAEFSVQSLKYQHGLAGEKLRELITNSHRIEQKTRNAGLMVIEGAK